MNLLEKLKHETRPHHDQIEKSLDLLRADMDLSLYIKILQRFLGFYRPLEHTLRQLTLPLDYSDRYKSHLLGIDLKNLGAASDSDVRSEWSAPTFFSTEEVLGALYVIEGSTLGGQVLSRHFALKFGLKSNEGLEFFCGYKDQTLSKWKEFQSLLLSFSTPESDPVIVDSAKKTFLALETWMVSSVKM